MQTRDDHPDFGLEQHLVAGIWSLMIFLIASIGWLTLSPSSPGPRLSGGVSFNEKAKWLRRNLADRTCDVVVVGSSIAVNTFDAASFTERWPGKVVNTGFWGMPPVDAPKMLDAILGVCTPKIVIMPTFYGDYAGGPTDLNWPLFARFVHGNSIAASAAAYLSSMDLQYYIQQAFESSRAQYRERREYASLNFDASGAVNFACEGFRVSQNRWDGYRSIGKPPELPQTSLDAVSEVARMSAERGILFIVAATPLRPIAERTLYPEAIDKLWANVELAVARHGGLFTRVTSEPDYNDPQFVDFAHLNACGAKRWTSTVLARFDHQITQRMIAARR